jgi:hypothetical protein
MIGDAPVAVKGEDVAVLEAGHRQVVLVARIGHHGEDGERDGG